MRKTYVSPQLTVEEYVQDTMIASCGPSKKDKASCCWSGSQGGWGWPWWPMSGKN